MNKNFNGQDKEMSSQVQTEVATSFEDGVIGKWIEGTGDKKYKVILYRNMDDYQNGRTWKTVQFGAKGYQQYQDLTPLKLYSADDHLDDRRRNSYRARHGAQGYQENEYSPAWFSWHFLW